MASGIDPEHNSGHGHDEYEWNDHFNHIVTRPACPIKGDQESNQLLIAFYWFPISVASWGIYVIG